VKGNKILIQQREAQLAQRRKQYNWLQFPGYGIPSGFDDSRGHLPANEQFRAIKNVDFMAMLLVGLLVWENATYF